MGLLDRVGRFIDDVLLLPEELRQAIEQGEQALGAGHHREAAARFERVLEDRPGLARAAHGLARARLGLGDVRAARIAVDSARETDPDDPEVALLAARLALEEGDYSGAVRSARDAQFRLATEGGTRLAEASTVRAHAEWRRGRPDRAARELRKALAAKPDVLLTRVELVEALVASGRASLARAAVSGAQPATTPVELASRIGLALHRARAGAAAMAWLVRAGDGGDPRALVVLARDALASGETERAESLARRAVSRGGGAEALATVAQVALAQGNAAEAADAYAYAATLGGDVTLLREAVRVAPLDAPEVLERHALALEAVAPGDPGVAVARAWALLGRGEIAGAALLLAAPETDGEPRAHLGRARLALLASRAQDALDHLDRAAQSRPVSLDVPRLDALRRDALLSLWRTADGTVDLAGVLDQVARHAGDHGLGATQRDTTALRDELDRPLLLAVLGEFNAGKSTLVNAFVGADVAPTGVVPTTATLNVLRGGAERRVRVVRRDGTTREGEYAQLRALLTEAGGESGADVDRVEIILPAEFLERVWILDTPGSNALDPRHEALAAEAVRRADAVLWLFSAGQAGKESERRTLGRILATRRHVVPVVNKADRLTPDELAAVQKVLREELPDVVRDVSPVSARTAMRARIEGDDAQYDQSGFPALLARLEREVFSQSRRLKRDATAHRLLAILDEALATEPAAIAEHAHAIEELRASGPPLDAASARLGALVDQAVLGLSRDVDEAFREAAREIVAFVRPRTSRFARHGADREDRAFLADVLERRLGHAVSACEEELATQCRAQLAPHLRAPDLDARLRAAVAHPLADFAGYQRGLLAGGALERFFRDVLPDTELSIDPLAKALADLRADPHERLRPQLADVLAELVSALDDEREVELARHERARERLVAGTYAPLRALREVLGSLAA